MPVARCCAAIPKQRDSLMLSYKQGFTHAERRPHAVIHAGLYPFREMSSCCHTSWAAILISHALQQGDMT